MTWPHLLGYLYQQTGRLEEAAAGSSRRAACAPDDRAAAVRLGDVYLGLNRLARRSRAVRQASRRCSRRWRDKGWAKIALRERRVRRGDRITFTPRSTGCRRHRRPLLAGDGVSRARPPGRGALAAGAARRWRNHGRRPDRRRPADARARRTWARRQGGGPTRPDSFRRRRTRLRRRSPRRPRAPLRGSTSGWRSCSWGIQPRLLPTCVAAFEQAPDDPDRAASCCGRCSGFAATMTRFEVPDQDEIGQSGRRGDDRESRDPAGGQQRYREPLRAAREANRRFPDRTATATTLARLLASSPDRSLRDGRRALELATAVHTAEPTPAHGETVALALAELGRCDEAVMWMRRAVAEAEQGSDSAEAARLKSELPAYDGAMCSAIGGGSAKTGLLSGAGPSWPALFVPFVIFVAFVFKSRTARRS